MTVDCARISEVVDAVYAWSRQHNYRGYNKHDGLNSPLLKVLMGWGRWPRMIAIQTIMRFPANVRPLLLTPRTFNPKGLALFTQGLLDRYHFGADPAHLAEAEALLGQLLKLRSPGEWQGDCWGYHYPWQDPGFYARTNTPNAVVTAFVCEAFLDAYEVTGKRLYIETVGSAIRFFLNNLIVLKDLGGELCLGYMPLPMTMRVMDVSILIGAVIARYGALSGDSSYREKADRLVYYVVNRQTDEGAWYYTDPPQDSRIRHDNYHTGFILDALWRYMEATGDQRWRPQYDRGLEFYAGRLFNPDGSPRWMSDQDYPHDIHGAAQGILTFARHRQEYPGLSDRIAQWVLDRMYDPCGRFYYQEGRIFIKRFTLLRWCNAWMVRGLGAWLRCNRLTAEASAGQLISGDSAGLLRKRTLGA